MGFFNFALKFLYFIVKEICMNIGLSAWVQLFSKKVEPMLRALYSCIFPLLWNMKEFQRKIEKSKNFCYFLILSAVRLSKWIRNTPRMFPTTYPTIKPHFFVFKTKLYLFLKSLPSSLKPTVGGLEIIWKWFLFFL